MTHQVVNHEYTQSNGLQVVLQQLTEANEAELVDQIYALSDRPEVLGLLIYKLMMERKKTNELLDDINKKYDYLTKALNDFGRENTKTIAQESTDIVSLFLTEQDKTILQMAAENHLTAKKVQDSIGYKGLNAASQRLNKLCTQGYLDKQRVGQQVVFVLADKYKANM